MTLLAPNPDLEFHEDIHRYWLKSSSTWVPFSVTAIASPGLSDHAKQQIAKTKHIWEPRGNTVHAVLESFLLEQPLPDCGDYCEWTQPLLELPLWDRFKPIGVEYRMVSRDGYYAGSLDCLLKGPDKDGNDIVVLGDLKTLAKPHSKTRSIATQAGGYIAMLNDMGVEVHKVLGIFAKPGSTELRVEDPADCLLKWCEALDYHKMQQEAF